MGFYEVIRTRRSIRAYRPDPIPEEVLSRVKDIFKATTVGV